MNIVLFLISFPIQCFLFGWEERATTTTGIWGSSFWINDLMINFQCVVTKGLWRCNLSVPHFTTVDWKHPDIMFTAVKEWGQASAARDANVLLVITLPGLAARYPLHALLLKDLKTPTSSGCKIWVICEGRHNRWTLLRSSGQLNKLIRYMWAMAIHDKQDWSSGGILRRKKLTTA